MIYHACGVYRYGMLEAEKLDILYHGNVVLVHCMRGVRSEGRHAAMLYGLHCFPFWVALGQFVHLSLILDLRAVGPTPVNKVRLIEWTALPRCSCC